jgi:hypothetical protein
MRFSLIDLSASLPPLCDIPLLFPPGVSNSRLLRQVSLGDNHPWKSSATGTKTSHSFWRKLLITLVPSNYPLGNVSPYDPENPTP